MQRRSLAAAVKLSWILMFLLVKSCQILSNCRYSPRCVMRASVVLVPLCRVWRCKVEVFKCKVHEQEQESVFNAIRHQTQGVIHFSWFLCRSMLHVLQIVDLLRRLAMPTVRLYVGNLPKDRAASLACLT